MFSTIVNKKLGKKDLNVLNCLVENGYTETFLYTKYLRFKKRKRTKNKCSVSYKNCSEPMFKELGLIKEGLRLGNV